jgi:SNF2 family DNA or RNA helicase
MNVIISPKHHVIGVPMREDLANIFASAKHVEHNGQQLLLVNHGIDETKLLRNVGFDVPPPILTHYDWEGGTPFEAQKKTCAMLTMNQRAYVLSSMGTGKSKSALWAWRYLNRIGQAKKLLIIAPLSTLNFTWAKEIFQTLPGVRCQVLHGTKQKRLSKLADPEADIFIVNHDGAGVIAEELIARNDIDTVVLDELAVYRNGTATRTKVTKKVTANKKWVWGMTGSPTPNAPTDAWSQCSLITPHTVPKYFNRFKEEVMYRVTQYKWMPKEDAIDKVYAAMQPAVRFTLDDVTELPEIIERTIDVELGPKQEKVYKQMQDHAFAAVASHEITAVNAGVVLNKLLQISLGYVYSNDKGIVALDNEERLNAVVDIVNSTDRKVIVFAPFVHALEGISKKLTSEGYSVRTVSGDTPKAERDEVFNLFQNTNTPKVLVAHPQCLAHGLTLHAANTVVWTAPITSLEIFDQANARVRRVGQTHKQQIIMLQGTPVEKKAYARLRSKQHVQNLLLDMFTEASK